MTDVQIWIAFAVLVASTPAAVERLNAISSRRATTPAFVPSLGSVLLFAVPALIFMDQMPDLVKERGCQFLSANLLIRTGDPSYYTDGKKHTVNADVARGQNILVQASFW